MTSDITNQDVDERADDEPVPRFLSPALGVRAWPFLAPWNRAGLEAFAVAFREAKRREMRRERWTVTLEEWLPTLGLSQTQWEGILLPWAASLFSGSIDPILYDVLKPGMIEVLRRLIDQSPSARVVTGAAVGSVAREGNHSESAAPTVAPSSSTISSWRRRDRPACGSSAGRNRASTGGPRANRVHRRAHRHPRRSALRSGTPDLSILFELPPGSERVAGTPGARPDLVRRRLHLSVRLPGDHAPLGPARRARAPGAIGTPRPPATGRPARRVNAGTARSATCS
jgi:hypothetical protein